LFNRVVTHDYRMAPAMTVRLTGFALMLLAGAVFVIGIVATLLNLGAWIFGVVAVLGLATIAGCALWIQRLVVVHLDDDGYRVRMVRGVGTASARWAEVSELVTTYVASEPCAVLRLTEGRTTTIPVTAVAGDREQFIRDLQQHLQRGHGLRRLDQSPET
jgi:hypothetical protein